MLLEYSLTTDDYVAFNEHFLKTSDAIRNQQARARVLSSVVCIPLSLVLIGVVFSDWSGGLIVGVVAAAAMWFVYPRLNWWLATRTLRKLVADGGAGAVGAVRLILEDTGLTEELAGTTTSVTWGGIARVTESRDHYFVFTGSATGIIVPKRAAGSAELIAAVRGGDTV